VLCNSFNLLGCRWCRRPVLLSIEFPVTSPQFPEKRWKAENGSAKWQEFGSRHCTRSPFETVKMVKVGIGLLPPNREKNPIHAGLAAGRQALSLCSSPSVTERWAERAAAARPPGAPTFRQCLCAGLAANSADSTNSATAKEAVCRNTAITTCHQDSLPQN